MERKGRENKVDRQRGKQTNRIAFANVSIS